MTLIDGDRIVTAQLYDDEHEEFIEKKMSIIDYVNAYTDEEVTTADDVLNKIRAEILAMMPSLGIWMYEEGHIEEQTACEVIADVVQIIDKYKAEVEPRSESEG